MKRAHLGDSIDFWKRGLIGYLRTAAIIERIEVVPMPTDARAWTSVELEVYAAVLGVSVDDLRGTGRFTRAGRTPYFNSLTITTDVFVDPDTGVAEPATTAAHVSALECGRLLSKNTPNIVMVYQHAQRTSGWAKGQLAVLRAALCDVQAFAYQSSVVGMLFLSRDTVRLQKVRSALSDLLGPAASGLNDFPARIVL
jgi:hypothetical protein